MIVNAPDLMYSMKNLGNLHLKGFPLDRDIFSRSPIPKGGQKAQTLEEILDPSKGAQEPDIFPKILIAQDTRQSSPKLASAL